MGKTPRWDRWDEGVGEGNVGRIACSFKIASPESAEADFLERGMTVREDSRKVVVFEVVGGDEVEGLEVGRVMEERRKERER